MIDSQKRKVTRKAVVVVLLAAIVTAVVATVIQQLLLGHSTPAVTGAIVGIVMGAMAITTMRKSSGS